MRKWIKSIFREVIQEEITQSPLIISYNVPNPDDVYQKGTIWLHGTEKWIAKEVKVTWEKL
jgi:hypothetical protein